jgi:hypothetical protein
VRYLSDALAGRSAGHRAPYLERDVRVNSNEELALPKEKLQELHI